jgi:dihydrofolate reductase
VSGEGGSPRIVLVAAVADNGVIGHGGELPWRIKSEMARFRERTWGKPIVVGRKTYQSFNRKPLPGRTNIIVSRDADFTAEGCVVAQNLDTAFAVARADALRRSANEIIVLGGADIYRQTMAQANRLVVTHVHLRPQGDARFPDIDPATWAEVNREEITAGPDDAASYAIAVYEPIARE